MAGLKTYYRLTKPGIVYGNIWPLLAGYFLAAYGLDIPRLLAALFGQSLVIAGSCVFNNILDRRIDARMDRTAKRALVTGEVSVKIACLYGLILAVVGTYLLFAYVNPMTAWLGLAGVLLYVLAYGWGKRHTTFGTLIGAVPGALPPVAGYTAITAQLDLTALTLFLILVFWQMAHFYAIGMFRIKDYAAANLQILPLKRPAAVIRRRTNWYVLAFGAAGLTLWLTQPVGGLYLLVVVGISAYWLYRGRAGHVLPDEKWGRLMFGMSLIALLVVCAAIAGGRYIP